MSTRPAPQDAWIISSWPEGTDKKISDLRRAYGKLERPAAWEVARYMEPTGPLSWTDLKKAALDLSQYADSQTWPALSAKLREIVRDTGNESRMPLDIELNLWQQVIDKQIETHPSSLGSTSSASNSDSSFVFTPSPGASKQSHQVIVYRAHMVITAGRGRSVKETIVLDPPTMDLACRYYAADHFPGLSSYCGADRFIRVHINLEDQWNLRNEKAKAAFETKARSGIWVGANLYRPFISKDDNLFLYCERGPSLPWVDLHTYVDHYIPFKLNKHMTIDKWIARFQLGLSKIVPTETFEAYQVRRVPNIYSNSLPIGRFRMRKIVEAILCINGAFELPYTPTAIRGVVGGRTLYWKLVHEPELADEDTNYLYLPKDYRPPASPSKMWFYIDRLDGTSMKAYVSGNVEFRYTDQEWQGEGADMTDGHGLISEEAAVQISASLGHESISQAYQARYLGAKGVWSPLPASMSHTDGEEQKWIEIRDSQLKYFTPKDRSGVFEVVRSSDPRPPIDMSHQLLQILSNNGVSTELFQQMIERARESELEEFNRLELTSPQGLRKFLTKLDPTALEKEAKASAIAASPGDVVKKRNFSAMEAEDLDLRKGSRQFLNDFSHMPAFASQRALALLDAGFNPEENAYFARLLLDLFGDTSVESSGKAVAIPCQLSTNLIVVPDPTGTLASGEVFYQSSRAFAHATMLKDGRIRPARMKQGLSGECLVTRDPALLPTDVQKVTAVDNPALKDFMDVIVFPTQGPVALCSLLGGGDYDGDTVKVIWDSAIVSSFQNAPQSMAFAPDDLEEVWIDARHGYMTDDDCSFDKREASEESSTQISALLSSTLFTPKQFGMLANMHTTAAYEKGLGHDDTRLLAYLFAISLDGAKSGKYIKPSKMKQLQSLYGRRFPDWAREVPLDPWQKYLLAEKQEDCKRELKERHVMDILRDRFFELAKDQRAAASARLCSNNYDNDEVLREFHRQMAIEAEEDENLAADLRSLRHQVNICFNDFRNLNGEVSSRRVDPQSSPQKARSVGREHYTKSLARICENMNHPLDLKSRRFNAFDGPELCRKYKASYLYDSLCMGERLSPSDATSSTRLKGPWTFFFRELTNFKANQRVRELDAFRGGTAMQGATAQSLTDEAFTAVKRRRLR